MLGIFSGSIDKMKKKMMMMLLDAFDDDETYRKKSRNLGHLGELEGVL